MRWKGYGGRKKLRTRRVMEARARQEREGVERRKKREVGNEIKLKRT